MPCDARNDFVMWLVIALVVAFAVLTEFMLRMYDDNDLL